MRHLRNLALAFATFAALSCADDATAPELSAPAPVPAAGSAADVAADSAALALIDLNGLGRLPLLGTLLTCDVLPRESTSRTIGPDGGVIQVGPHRLEIPRGALTRNVVITAAITGDNVSSVRFTPEGLQFRRSATLTLSYQHCPLVPSLLPKRIAYTTDGLRILELLRSIDFLWRKEVTAPIDHFSKYAVAY